MFEKPDGSSNFDENGSYIWESLYYLLKHLSASYIQEGLIIESVL